MTTKLMMMSAAGLALAACTQPGAGSGSASGTPATPPPGSTSTTFVAPTLPPANTPAVTPNAGPPEPNPYGPPPAYPPAAQMPPQQGAPRPAGREAPPIRNSLADGILRGDVLRTMLRASGQIVPGCDTQQAIQTLDVGTATVRQSGDGAWSEVWPVSMCGQTRSIRIDFTPTPPSGTNFRIRLNPTSADGNDGKSTKG